MSPGAMDDETLRILLLAMSSPMETLRDTEEAYYLPSALGISRRYPRFSSGFGRHLCPESRFYKRRFSCAGGKEGWALIFHSFDPTGAPDQIPEYLGGWVPLDREQDVDQWATFLNAEIRDRLTAAGMAVRHRGAGDGIVRTRTKLDGGRALVVVGTFQESPANDDPEAPSILAAVGTGHRGAADRVAIAAYLRSAPAMWKTMGLEVDLLDPSQYAGSGSLLGDGTYAWPDTLAHYVALDDVGLPADFEAHVLAHAASVPDPADTTQPAAGPMGPRKPPRTLLMAGNFRELGFLRAIGGAAPPSFVAARGKSGRTAKATESVARYLRAGWELGPRVQQRGDVFEPAIAAGHTGLLTDGVHAWPHLLAHYVERYDVALPPDFEERMRKRLWSPPMAVDTNAVLRP